MGEDIKKALKAAKRRMETEFAMNKQSIQDMVQQAVQQELGKHKPAYPPTKETSASRKNSRSRKSDRSNSRGHKNDRSNSRMTDPAPKTEILAKNVTEGIRISRRLHTKPTQLIKTTETAKTMPR